MFHTLCSSENYSAALLDNGGSSPITKKYSEKCRENLKWLEEWYQINPISILLRIYLVFHSAWVLLSAFRLLGLWVKDTFPVPCGNLSPESQRHFRYLNSSSSELVAPLNLDMLSLCKDQSGFSSCFSKTSSEGPSLFLWYIIIFVTFGSFFTGDLTFLSSCWGMLCALRYVSQRGSRYPPLSD